MIVVSSIPAVPSSFALPLAIQTRKALTYALWAIKPSQQFAYGTSETVSFPIQNSGQTQNRPCLETVWHTGLFLAPRSFWLNQSGLCTPKVIKMVWITESCKHRGISPQDDDQYWNLPYYAEIGWLGKFLSTWKIALKHIFSTQTKKKPTKNILGRNKMALMKSKAATLSCIQILLTTLYLRVHRIKVLNFATTFFCSGAWRTGLFKFGFWYGYPRKTGGEDIGKDIYHSSKSREWGHNWYCLVTCGYAFLWGLLSMDSYCAAFGVTWYSNLTEYCFMRRTSSNILVTSCLGHDHLQVLMDISNLTSDFPVSM